MTATSNLFYILDNTNSGTDQIDRMPATGGGAADLGDDTSGGVLYGLSTDAADGVYFVTSLSGASSFIYEEHFGQTPQFSSPIGGGAIATGIDDDVTSLALNASDDILYFTSGSGFYEEKFGAGFSGTPTEVKLATFTGLPGPNSAVAATQQIAFDADDHAAYFAAPSYSVTQTTNTAGTAIITVSSIHSNYIYKVSGVTSGATAGSLTSNESVVNLGGPDDQLPFADGAISAVTLDAKTDTLYIATKGVVGTAANHAGIYAYDIGTGAVSTVWSESVAGATSLTDMNYITVDATTGDYYVTDGALSPHPGIYEGNINSSAAPTVLVPESASGVSTAGLAIDPAPTVASIAVTAIDGNPAHTTGTVTTADSLAISVTFNENVSVTGTPTLTLNDGGSATYVSGAGTSVLVFSYQPASGQNATTLATTGESGGAITDSATTAADFADIVKSFTGLSVQTTAPSLSVTGATGEELQGAGIASTLLQTDSISDASGSGTLTQATITIADAQAGDSLSIAGLSGGTVDGGAVTVTGAGTSTLTLSGAASLAEYQSLLASVTYQDTGADSSAGAHPTRTIDWKVDDGVLPSNTATTTATIERAPTINAGGVADYSKIGPPVVADSTLTVNDLDGDQIQGASVQISSGFLSGDELSAGPGVSPSINVSYDGATGVLSLTGSDTVADYQAALDAVTFSTTAPIGADTSRTLTWTVDDGLASNATTETSTVDVAPCYCRGARILTERGEVAVEDLRVGDGVVTAQGRTRPIVWIGHRDIEVARHAFPLEILPVRVRAGAFGRGLPHRDLWLSPQHAVFVDGVLIPIIRLANGANVAQVRVERVSYFHVELETHDVLLAEGLPAESFLDCGSRSGFANAPGPVDLHPTFKPLSWNDACAPLVESGELVEAVGDRLRARAETLGFRRSDDPGLHIVADGETIWPQRHADGGFAFALPAGARTIMLASRSWRPADEAASDDKRCLGVAVSEIEIDGQMLPLTALGGGWHPVEREAERAWRWSDGLALLPVGARSILVRLGVGRYWVETEPREAREAA